MTSPLKLNAMDPMLRHECSKIWGDVDADRSVLAVIITGPNNTFSAGGDLKHEQKVSQDYNLGIETMKEARDIVYGMINCSKPIVGAIRRWAVGTGLASGLIADISVVARYAKIMDGHTNICFAAGDHAAIIWPLLCGKAKYKYYLLLCETLTGEEAEQIGLVSLAVDYEEVEQKALEIAGRLAQGAPAAIRSTKDALNNRLSQAGPIFDTSLAREMIGIEGPEGGEGIVRLSGNTTACVSSGYPGPSIQTPIVTFDFVALLCSWLAMARASPMAP